VALDPISLAYGKTGQRLTCPHRGASVPTAAVNVQLLDSDGSEVLAATAATKGTFSSTVATAADPGDTSIVMAAVVGLVAGEPFVLASGVDSEVCEARRISGVTVTLKDPLARSWAVGTTAKSALIYYDANLSVTATFPIGLYYQAIWTCTDWAHIRAQVFRIVTRETTNPIEFDHVRRVLPQVGSLRDGDEEPTLQDQRDAAWQIMSSMLLSEGIDPSVLRDPERFGQAGGALAAALFVMARPGGLELAGELAGSPPSTGGLFLEWYRRARMVPHWVDRDQDAVRDELETRVGPRRMRRGL
jgi:hypothetical protein